MKFLFFSFSYSFFFRTRFAEIYILSKIPFDPISFFIFFFFMLFCIIFFHNYLIYNNLNNFKKSSVYIKTAIR